MAITSLDHYEGEDVIITFEREGSQTITNVDGKVLTWNSGGGAQPTEDVYAFGGKTFNFQKPREKFTLSFDIMINDTFFDFAQFGSNSTTPDSSNNRLVLSTDATSRWRIIFWFQDSQYHVSNSGNTVTVPSQDQAIYRMICCDVKSVTFDKEFSADEYMKGTLNLEFSSADSDGFANFIEQEGIYNGTTSTILASMTTTATDAASNSGLLRISKGYLDWSATTTPSWTAGTTTTRYRYTN